MTLSGIYYTFFYFLISYHIAEKDADPVVKEHLHEFDETEQSKYFSSSIRILKTLPFEGGYWSRPLMGSGEDYDPTNIRSKSSWTWPGTYKQATSRTARG